jgi:hypothetical protein
VLLQHIAHDACGMASLSFQPIEAQQTSNFADPRSFKVFWDSQVLQLKSSKQSLRSSGSAMVTKFPEKLN